MFFFTFGFLLSTVQCWNQDGHKIIAALAAPQLSSAGRRLIGDHLAGVSIKASMMDASGWADEISLARPETSPLHFVYTPNRMCMPYDAIRDCPGGECIVTAIAKYSQIAIDLDATPLSRIEAIQFLIHFLADIHQPLHVSFRMDGGGTGIHLDDPLMSLHEVWDFEIFNSFGEPKIIDRLVSELKQSTLTQKASPPVDWENYGAVETFAAGMATDTGTKVTCTIAYKEVSGAWIINKDRLSPAYMERGRKFVQLQLVRAAKQLGRLINGLGEVYIKRWAERKPVKTVLCAEPRSTNRFFELDIDFDVDDVACSDMEDSTDTGEAMEARVEPVLEVKQIGKIVKPNKKKKKAAAKLPVRASNAADESQAVVSIPPIRDSEHEQFEEENDFDVSASGKSRKSKRSKMFEGVNLKRVILIANSACGMNMVTTETVRRENRISFTGTLVDVEFKGNAEGKKHVRFFFEDAAFRAPLSDELIVKALLALRKLPANLAGVRVHQPSALEIAPIANARVVYEDRVPEMPKEAGWEDSVLAKLPRMVIVRQGRVALVSTMDCMLATAKTFGRIRTREYSVPALDSLLEHRLLIDTAWVDGPMTPRLAEAIMGASDRALPLSLQLLLYRPTLPYEIMELETFLFDEDIHRLEFLELIDIIGREEANVHKSSYFLEWQRSPFGMQETARLMRRNMDSK